VKDGVVADTDIAADNRNSRQGSEPLVSVVICNYNCERYLAEAIDSVLRQSYRRCEIVVVDDG
jgi:cellulose synthase/poly-beta-1,6-N-acetylglucosamine synthase-like glycosyltransferase